jgi:ABC-type Fe3+-citrate transport system substrate-binding protein
VDKYRASYEQYQSAYTKLADKVTDKTAEHHQRLAEKDAIITELEKRLRTGAREPNNSSLQS